jgi:hypothetical protein
MIGGGTKPADATVIVDRWFAAGATGRKCEDRGMALQMLMIGPLDAGGNAEGEASG